MPNSSCCVVIPVYQSNPPKEEWASFRQALTILKDYNCILVCAHNFDLTLYLEFADQYSEKPIQVVRFAPEYFASISGYNKLLLRPFFYRHFRNYTYLLIYQLDAWVFCDELMYWCNQNYDYIGAPWFEGWGNATKKSVFAGVGNGGFSLRNVQSHIAILTSFHYIESPATLIKKFRLRPGMKSLYRLICDLTFRNNTYYLFHSLNPNEDYFWGLQVAGSVSSFKVPDIGTAMQFSMEVNSPMLYQLNNHKLPFGCHAWEKYDKVFWQQFIKIEY